MGKRARRKRRNQKRARRGGAFHLVSSFGGGPIDPDGCPLCAEATRSGEPVFEIDSGWSSLELITVEFCGDTTLWPVVPDRPTRVTVLAGCDLEGLIQYLFACYPALAKAAEIEGINARVNGEDSHAARALRDGDQITLSRAAPALQVPA